MNEYSPSITSQKDNDNNLKLDLLFRTETGRCCRDVYLTLDEEGAKRLRDTLTRYIDSRMEDFKRFWNEGREGVSARQPKKVLPQRVSLETMRDIFTDLAESKAPFFCVFEKQDGSIREMNARMIGPVQYSYKTRSSYANVIDLDIKRERIVAALKANDPRLCEGSTYERKIVLSRVSEVSGEGFCFISNGR